jgi:hypothetical protein
MTDGTKEQGTTPAAVPYVGRLDSVRRLRREMMHVYKEMRQGKLATQKGGRLMFALTCILKTLELELIEGRLDAVERVMQESGLLPDERQRVLSRTGLTLDA